MWTWGLGLGFTGWLITLEIVESSHQENLYPLSENNLYSFHQDKLYQSLFNGYNPLIRPLEHANQSVVVDFELFIAQLVHVDEV